MSRCVGVFADDMTRCNREAAHSGTCEKDVILCATTSCVREAGHPGVHYISPPLTYPEQCKEMDRGERCEGIEGHEGAHLSSVMRARTDSVHERIAAALERIADESERIATALVRLVGVLDEERT